MKKIILIAVLAIVALAGYGQPVMVAHYNFNGNTDDVYGTNHGTVSSASMQYVTGHDGTPNSALLFNGINDYVAMPNSSIGAPVVSHSTVTAWIRLDAPISPANWPIITFGQVNLSSVAKNYLTLGISHDYKIKGGNFAWSITPVDSNAQYVVSGFDFNNYIGQWIPIAFQIRVPLVPSPWDYASIRFYANGQCLFSQPYFSESLGSGDLDPIADTMFVGYGRFDGPPLATQQYFKGAIDDIRIYGALGGPGTQWLTEQELDSLFGLPAITTELNDVPAPVRFSVYPNPASQAVNISSEDLFESVDMFAVSGQLVRSEIFKMATRATIDISDLNPGIYMVRINFVSGSVSQQKVVIK